MCRFHGAEVSGRNTASTGQSIRPRLATNRLAAHETYRIAEIGGHIAPLSMLLRPDD